MRDEIRKILPEVDEIRDQSLRDKVLATWEAGLARGGWKPADIARMKSNRGFVKYVKRVDQARPERGG